MSVIVHQYVDWFKYWRLCKQAKTHLQIFWYCYLIGHYDREMEQAHDVAIYIM